MGNALMDTPDVLKKIAAYKADEVEALREDISIEELRDIANSLPRPRGFTKAIQAQSGPALICEIKKASPSKGIIREDFDPVAIARAYTEGGAACLSVLTDGPGFMGSPAIIAESAAMGADCVLVIMAMIHDDTAGRLIEEASLLGMDALIETHDETELERAIALGGTLIGINNRDLRTFETTLDTFTNLAPSVPKEATLIAESGVFTRDDVERLAKAGAQGYLIGESFMRQDDVAGAVRELL